MRQAKWAEACRFALMQQMKKPFSLFLNGEIRLYRISEIVEKMLSEHSLVKTPSIQEIFEIDNEIRAKTREITRL